jgi:hypothetical protein
MPALPAVSGLVKVLLQYALPTVASVLNRIWFQGTGSTTNAALNTWCTNVANAWNSNMAAKTLPTCSLVAVTAEDYSSLTSPIGAWTGSHAGTVTGGVNTQPATSLIIRNHTPLRARGGHSRTYLPGMDGNALTTGSSSDWTASSAASILTAWEAFLAAVTGSNGPTGYSGFAQVVPNYYKGFTAVENTLTGRYKNVAKVNPSPTTQIVTSQTVNLVVGAQRRRNHQST